MDRLVKGPLRAVRYLRHKGRILLKNSSLIEGVIADSLVILIGGFRDDGTEAGSTGGAVL